MVRTNIDLMTEVFFTHGELPLDEALEVFEELGGKVTESTKTTYYRVKRDFTDIRFAMRRLGVDAPPEAVQDSAKKSGSNYFKWDDRLYQRVRGEMLNGQKKIPTIEQLLVLDQFIRSSGFEVVGKAVALVESTGSVDEAKAILTFIEKAGGGVVVGELLRAWERVRTDLQKLEGT